MDPESQGHERQTSMPPACRRDPLALVDLEAAILVLGEVGLPRVVLPAAAIDEAKRDVQQKLPDAIPAFEIFLTSPFIETWILRENLESAA